jgi:hypothetical protein
VFELYKSTVIVSAIGMIIMFVWLLNESLPSSVKFIKPAETAFVRNTPTTEEKATVYAHFQKPIEKTATAHAIDLSNLLTATAAATNANNNANLPTPELESILKSLATAAAIPRNLPTTTRTPLTP